MIDKNDVKMPVQRDNMDALANAEQIEKIEELLDLVSDAENKQELRLKRDYYKRFPWFGSGVEGRGKSYFSYQEEAAYDFIFNLNKSGILSDQVGMGKTVEAGMIISELASRNELRSLLIIVPNEIMAKKWEYELEHKFGIKAHTRNKDGVEEVYPKVKTLKNYDEFCRCIFDCLVKEWFIEYSRHSYVHEYEAKPGKEEHLSDVIAAFVKEDIATTVKLLNADLDDRGMDVNVAFDGKEFRLVGDALPKDRTFRRAYRYDASGAIAKFVNGRNGAKMLEQTVRNPRFKRSYNQELIRGELAELFVLIGDYFTTLPDELPEIAKSMTNNYHFLAIPISYTEQEGDKLVHHDFLNHPLLSEIQSYKHKYIVQDEKGKIDEKFEEYRIIDFFIDVGYQTLIVDEVHDYIDVCAKTERDRFHDNRGYETYPSSDYNRFELFDDYYFIKKSSLYKKLKQLADKATRKIFLTATPIKSDMVDFYLLTLLASNKDSEAYKKIGENLDAAFPDQRKREKKIEDLYHAFKTCVEETSARYFSGYSGTFFRTEVGNGRSFKYPYFKNSFLMANAHDENRIRKYLLSHLSYLSMEEVVMELILAYQAESVEENKRGAIEFHIRKTMEELDDLLADDVGNDLQTRVVFRCLFNNTIKIRFEEDFADEKGKPIKRIRELLEMEDGPRRWHKTYRKYGIRHTRHQTYNLSDCKELDKLSKNRVERYRNLPIWPRRDGKVIYLVRDDIFFDCFQNVKRQWSAEEESEITLRDLPNFEQLTGSEEQKQERFNNAKAIFDYINNAMSGGSADTHEPSNSKYESVELDDAGMADYKLAMINRLMKGNEQALGSVQKKVLLFAENDRDAIVEWFKYQSCKPLCDGFVPDPAKMKEYESKWQRYDVSPLGDDWAVSENAEDLTNRTGNLLIIIDPKRYEKGVDLQKADTIINFDINYDPLKMEQRIGRIDRIRPNGQTQEINIVSFVPLNDMSGYVINFFANELKMFTQWMGETTGIVSVPEEGNTAALGEDVSFEGKVYKLEKYYKDLYSLCKEDLPQGDIKKMAADYVRFFAVKQSEEDKKAFRVSDYRTDVDFRFLQALRPSFDRMFRNSISPLRAGYKVTGNAGARVMRFNSSAGVFAPCASIRCEGCPNKASCGAGAKNRNNYHAFTSAIKEFFEAGLKFYNKEYAVYQDMLRNRQINGAENVDVDRYLQARIAAFTKASQEVEKRLPAPNSAPFVITFSNYEEIFNPIKKLYWDEVAERYIGLILSQFHKQCDSVLNGAKMFEKFIKTLSIADFMNNMEGAINE